MTHIVESLVGFGVYVLKDGRKVIVGHFVKAEFPELFVLAGVILDVFLGMCVSPTISEPDIVALVGHHKARSSELVIQDPAIRAIEKAMLEENWLETSLDFGEFFLDSEDGEYVAIFSGDFVLLNRVLEIFTDLFETHLGLWVGSRLNDGRHYG